MSDNFVDFPETEKFLELSKKDLFINIPAFVAYSPHFTATEKLLYGIIKSLDKKNGCFATNLYLGKLLSIHPISVSAMISKLKKIGIVKTINFDGRRRILKIDNSFDQKNKKQKENLFISKYLSSNSVYKTENSPTLNFHQLQSDYIKSDFITKTIIEIPYNKFLQSPYWLIISEYKKFKVDYCCELCNSKNFLNTHHSTYKIRGIEIENLEKLKVLCNVCHEKFHDIVKD